VIIHHLNCGCMCPFGGALFDGSSKGLFAHLVCHCWLIETRTNGLVLVDTGFGCADVESPSRIDPGFRFFNNIKFRTSLTAQAQSRLASNPQTFATSYSPTLILIMRGG
jgi:hypothetical protein